MCFVQCLMTINFVIVEMCFSCHFICSVRFPLFIISNACLTQGELTAPESHLTITGLHVTFSSYTYQNILNCT